MGLSTALLGPALSLVLGLAPPQGPGSSQPPNPRHTFEIGAADFLLDGKPFLIRSGEMHAARIPREYWRHRLQMAKAMGCNTVCAYLFWNQHEPKPGEFDFTGPADAAEYCRIAQEVGLWVILRPGPYSCAEWEFGGFPWWLLKNPDLKVRTRDPVYLAAARNYLVHVGQQLAPLQVTRGGPILMVQVENEYGSYGSDKEYIGAIRDYLKEAGFEVPLFTCDGPSQLKNDTRDDLFSVVNFGSNPVDNFKALRAIRPQGPLMCGEFYPGWFDSWGRPHHRGKTDAIIRDLTSMLENNQSFSIYMVHGGTSFGFSSGANGGPFRPQSTSYDYDAPIDEAGRPTPKFQAIRDLFAKHLLPGEVLPDAPPANALMTLPEIAFRECAPLLDNLGTPRTDTRPRPMEMYDQATGCILYRTTLPAGKAGTLTIKDPHDIAQVLLDGRLLATLDRRYGKNRVDLPTRGRAQRLDILVEAMGRVCYGPDIHDRKGITQGVWLSDGSADSEVTGWEVFSMPLDTAYLGGLRYSATPAPPEAPAVYRSTFSLTSTADTFLDMQSWSKGAVWVNGHGLGRYWNIGPQQTLYLPGCWLKQGVNEILVLDMTGGVGAPTIRGLAEPILDQVGHDPLGPTRHRLPRQELKLEGVAPVGKGAFGAGREWQSVSIPPTKARFVCLEALNSHPGDQFTTGAELQIVDGAGKDLPRTGWTIVYADSEELDGDDGSASSLLDSQPATFWHTQWQNAKPGHPHAVVIDLGQEQAIAGLRYLPRQDMVNGRIKDYRVYTSLSPFPGLLPGP